MAKAVLVTGTSTGIGLAATRRLAAQGGPSMQRFRKIGRKTHENRA